MSKSLSIIYVSTITLSMYLPSTTVYISLSSPITHPHFSFHKRKHKFEGLQWKPQSHEWNFEWRFGVPSIDTGPESHLLAYRFGSWPDTTVWVLPVEECGQTKEYCMVLSTVECGLANKFSMVLPMVECDLAKQYYIIWYSIW